MNRMVIAAIVALGVSACDNGTSPSSPASPARPSAQSPSAAQSQSPLSSQPRESEIAQLSFDAVDTNKDGVITPAEALAVPGLDFSSADTDKSHTLSRQEFSAAMATVQPGG